MSDQPSMSSAPSSALPFWVSLLLPPMLAYSALQGGLSVLLVPLVVWYMSALADYVIGDNTHNADPETPDAKLFWHNAVTLIWPPVQFVTLFVLIWYVARAGHLGGLEKVGMFYSMGIATGTIGINYAHELMHQKSRLERWSADILLAMVLYSHFRSEHLLVHHRYVGTPRDPVTARRGENFYRFFRRVLWQCLASAFRAEGDRLARIDKPRWHRRNPFWLYAALQLSMLALAFGLAGWVGIGLFLVQAATAIWQLELVNYIEHYGLTRKHLGAGKYEPVKPRHSWNATPRVSSWVLINLQRHSDHHYKPDRRFPVLQNHDEADAPQLPHGYPIMGIVAMIPPLWRRWMHPLLKSWRRTHYPEISDWQAYDRGLNPQPR